MYELIRVGENTYYMDCPAKVGFYRTGPDEVVMIDSGSDQDAGKKAAKHLDAQGWQLRAIYNTHSHADHTGGNRYLQLHTGCPVYAIYNELCVVEHPFLEPTMLWGGYAMRDLRTKFLMARESDAERLTLNALPEGLCGIPLPGHSYDMVGFRTKDNAVFLADCLSSEETLRKYRIGFLYDVRAYLETLETVKGFKAACFIPSHGPVTEDIAPLAQINIDAVNEIADTITELLTEPKTFEELLSALFDRFGLTMTLQQYALVGSTVRSYLSYLNDEDRIRYAFEGSRMLWQKV